MLPRRFSGIGPVIEYIAHLESNGLRLQAKQAVAAVRSVLNSPEGAIVLDLLDKATLERAIDLSADPRALDAINAQSFIALDLRRILSDEFDEKAAPETAPVGTPRRRSGGAR
jgi:hypothetical protein